MCEITLSIEGDNDLLMTVTPVAGTLTTNIESLVNAFESSTYAKYARIENAIEQLFSEFTGKSTAPISAKTQAHSKIIASSIDATLTAVMSADKMSATLALTAAQGGKHLTYTDVLSDLKRNGIIKGISQKNIQSLVNQGQSLPAGERITITIATGKHCQHGNDGFIDYLVADPIKQILQPKELSNGKVDMRELGGVIHVAKGTKLAALIPPTLGVNGFTVTGTVIKATAGIACFIEEAEGSSFFDDSNTLLVANMSGTPKHLDHSISVNPLLETEHIDVSTGNIRFDGSIFVKGNVGEKMKIFATRDVIIGGVVEAAMVCAKGDICVAQGIIGHKTVDEQGQPKNSTVIQTNGDINAQFIQYADLTAHKNISVVHSISHSQISVQGSLWVGKRDSNIADGTLFGSDIKAGSTISVGVLGAPCEDNTRIDFNYWFEKRLDVTKKNKKQLRILINKSNKISDFIAKLSASNSQEYQDASLLLRLNNALKQHLALIIKYQQRIIPQEKTSTSHLETLSISVFKGLFRGVELTIADSNCTIKRDHDATKVLLKDKQITLEPIITTPNS